ncbi:MAG: AAA family ATPase, partial [Planctomycetes bacterium]|nr:AAA family ATPase [Planctomycetota bacterium]
MASVTIKELREWYNNCNPDAEFIGQVREGVDCYYIPLDEWREEGVETPIALRGPSAASELAGFIKDQGESSASAQLLAGFRGTGKTTELKQCQKRLGPEYAVMMLHADQYHGMTYAPSIGEMVMMIAAGIIDEAPKQLGIEERKQDRIKTEIKNICSKLKIPDISVGGIKFKDLFKNKSTNHDELKELRKKKPEELKNFLFKLINEVCEALKPRTLVLIMDDLEKFEIKQEEVYDFSRELADLFRDHWEILNLPGCHVIYTIPPFVAFLNMDIDDHYSDDLRRLSSIRIHSPPPERKPDHPGLHAINVLLDKRVPLELLFGEHRESCVQMLASATGGHVRGLLLSMRSVIRQIIRKNQDKKENEPIALPVSMETVQDGLAVHRAHFFVLFEEIMDIL